jgi:hypothetical protein
VCVVNRQTGSEYPSDGRRATESLILVDGGSSVTSPVEGEADDVISCLYDRHCNLSFCSPFLAWEAAGEHWMGGRG